MSKIQKNAEMLRSLHALHAVFESAPFAIIIADQAGHVLEVNPFVTTCFGLGRQELIGKKFSALCIPPKQRAEFDVLLENAVPYPGQLTFSQQDLNGRRGDGTEFPMYLEIRRAQIESRDVRLIFVRDITAKQRATREREIALQLAEKSSRAKSDFLAMMSHEVRTPLTGVLGILDILRDSLEEPSQRDLVSTAREAGEALLLMLSDILELSKMEAGALKLRPAEFEIRSLVQNLVEIVQPQAKQQGDTLSWSVADDVPAVLVGDAGRLRQVILNLLANATKFTERGRIDLAIRAVGRKGNVVTIRCEVEDTGVGIAQSQQGQLFKDFSTLHPSISRRFGGVGLGLAICKRIVEAAGGVISASSIAGQGSLFYFTMPLAIPDATSRGLAATRPVAQTGKARVLVTDDNATNRMVIQTMLEKAGHHVECVEDAPHALAALECGDFDCVLMDIAMPGTDGIAATQQIRAMALPTALVPVIGISANVDAEKRLHAMQMGMNDLVSKPFVQEEVLEAIEHHVGGGTRGSEFKEQKSREPGLGGAIDKNAISALREFATPEEVRSIVESWFGVLDETLELMRREPASAPNLKRLHQAAHKLASSSAQVGALRVSAVAIALQRVCSLGDAATAASQVEQLAAEGVIAKRVLRELTGAIDAPRPAASKPDAV